MVFSYHCVATRQVAGVFLLGPAGVAFFFLLSGFILTHTYACDFHTLSWSRARSFYVARVARIYPLHLVGMAFGSMVFAVSVPAVLAQLFLVQAWSPDPRIYRFVNPVSWSISIEAFFYLLFPVIAFALLKLFATASERVVLFAALGLWVAEAVALAPQAATIDDWRFYIFPPARLVDFVVGMLLGLAYSRRAADRTPERRGLHPTSVEILSVAGIALAIYGSALLPMALRFAVSLMPFFGAVVYVFARQQGALSRVLSSRFMIRLGEASYAFYLIHLTVISLLGRAPRWDNAPVMLVLSVGASLALNVWIETPMRRLLRRILGARGPAGDIGDSQTAVTELRTRRATPT